MLSAITASPPAMAQTTKINANQTPNQSFNAEMQGSLRHYKSIGALLKDRPDLIYKPTPEDLERQRASYERMIESQKRHMEAHKKFLEGLSDYESWLSGDITDTENKLETATGEEASALREHLTSLHSSLFNASRDIARMRAEWPELEAECLKEIARCKARLAQIDTIKATNESVAPSQPQPIAPASVSI